MYGGNYYGLGYYGQAYGIVIAYTKGGTMVSPIFGRSGTDATATERWTPLANYLSPAPTATESVNRNVMPGSGTLSNFFVKRTTAPGAGTSVKYTVVKNGVNTGITCTVSDTNTTASDTTNSVSYVAGDTLTLDILPTGTVVASTAYWSLESNGVGQPLLTGEATNLAAGTYYTSLMNGTFQAASTDIAQLIPTAGTIDSAYMDLSVTTGAAKTWTATLVKNGVDTSLVVTLTNATQASDTTHSVAVVAGDTAYWRVDATGAPASTRIRIGCRFTPTINGESIQMGSSTANLATSGPNYSGVQGGTNAYSATEGARANWLGTAFDVKKLYAAVDTANASATWTYTIRSNAANTAVTTAITGAGVTTNSDTTHTVTPTTGALLNLNIQGTTTPTASPARWGYVTYRAPVAQDTFTLSDTSVRTVVSPKSDSLTLSDTRVSAITQSWADSFTLTDHDTESQLRFGADSFTLSDGSILSVTQGKTDSFTLADSLTHIWVSYVTKSDTVTLTDARGLTPSKPLADTVTLSDARAVSPTEGKTDSFTLSDARITLLTLGRADSFTLSDVRGDSQRTTRNDVITLTDIPTTLLTAIRTFSDTFALTDGMGWVLTSLSVDYDQYPVVFLGTGRQAVQLSQPDTTRVIFKEENA